MRSILAALPLAIATVVCWGVYGPVLHHGNHDMLGSSLRAFTCVGISYFVIAVLIPMFLLQTAGEKGAWTVKGTVWSLLAGGCGAIGALALIMAFKFKGDPVYVMPLVFGCAPVINTIVSMAMTRSFREATPLFYAAILLVVLGAVGVLLFAPKASAAPHAQTDSHAVTTDATDQSHAPIETTADPSAPAATSETAPPAKPAVDFADRVVQWPLVIASIAMTALCWGCYGTVLHKGQIALEGSRLRAFLCVGLAYFVVAVIVPVILLATMGDRGEWTFDGTMWSLAAGAAGAFGALGMVMAFYMGGKPIWVMPLVFGGAPVVNTFIKMWENNLLGSMPALFLVSLGLVIVGAASVLIFSPKPHAKPADNSKSKPKDEAPVKSKPKKDQPAKEETPLGG